MCVHQLWSDTRASCCLLGSSGLKADTGCRLLQGPDWGTLPPLVLGKFLNGLTGREKYTLASFICRPWRQAVLESTKQLEVQLEDNAAFKSLSRWIRNHGSNLTHLSVTCNFSPRSIKALSCALVKCHSLQQLKLTLSDSRIQQASIDATANMQQLKSLTLNAVPVSASLAPLPTSLRHLSLTRLWDSHAQPISPRQPLEISHLQQLQTFDCSGIRHNLELQALSELSNLQEVTLEAGSQSNLLYGDLDPDSDPDYKAACWVSPNLQHLRKLHYMGCPDVPAVLAALPHSTTSSLEDLAFIACGSDSGDSGDYSQLNSLTALRSLDLVAMEDLPGASCFSRLTNLTRLSLCATQVGPGWEGLAAGLAGMKKLQVLDMSHACSSVTGLSILLYKLPWLKTLQVSRLDVDDMISGRPEHLEALARLQQALPGLRLEVKEH